jgi:hypothetical protein
VAPSPALLELPEQGLSIMRFWFSVPFIRRTRIGISVSDREIARALAPKRVTAKEREQRAAEIEKHAQDFAKRWTPFVSWIVVIVFLAVIVFWAAVICMIVWRWYLT